MSSQKFADIRKFQSTADYVAQHYLIELSEDMTLEDVLVPEYWRPVAHKISRLSIVTVIGGKDSIDADLRCIGVGQGFCIMRVIRTAAENFIDRNQASITEPSVRFIPGKNWCVLSDSGDPAETHIGTREEAEEKLKIFVGAKK